MDPNSLGAASELLKEMLSGNKLVVKPKVIWDLLDTLKRLGEQEQTTVLHQLLLASQQVLHNPCALSLDSQQDHHLSLLEFLLDFFISSPSDSPVHSKAIELIGVLVEQVGVRRNNTYFVYEYLAKRGGEAGRVRAALQALRTMLQPTRQVHPSNYFYFSGRGSGLEISTRPFDSFPFLKGLSMCLWLRLEEYQADPVSRLFVFHSKDYGGLEGYFVRNRLYYRTLPASEYVPPAEGSNGILLHEFQPEQWTFLAFEHERNLMARQSLRVVVDGNEVLNTTMDMPKPKSKSPLFSKAGLCLDFTGQLACAMVFEGPIEVQKMKAIYSHYNYGPEGQEALRSLFRILDKTLVPKLVMFYHPLRTAGGVAFEGAREADARLLPPSGVKLIPPSRMSYLGGICSLLPIVSLINDLPSPDRYSLLTDWAQLLFLCLKDRPENQVEALSLKFFKLLSEVLGSVPCPAISPDFLKLISDLNFTLMPHLREQLAVHFLWSLDLWRKTQPAVQMKLWDLLNYLYSTAPKTLSKAVGVGRILDLMFEYFEVREGCCKEHGGPAGQDLYGQMTPLFAIMKTVMVSSGDNALKEMKTLPGFLFSKPAPCIQKHLLTLIKSLISARPGEVVGSSPQALAKAFLEAQGMELLLFLLSNSTADVARVSLACVDTLLSVHLPLVSSEFLMSCKPAVYTEKDLLAYIGTVMIPKPTGEKPVDPPTEPKASTPQPIKPPKTRGFAFRRNEDFGGGKKEEKIGGIEIGEDSGPPQPPSMINRRKPNVKFQFGGDDSDDPQSLPTPPPPSKPSKPSTFSFPSSLPPDPPQSTPPLKLVKSFSSRKEKPPFALNLEIDTDKVNENYAYGGEKAVIRSEETSEQKLIREITELAQDCIKYMHGELVQAAENKLFPLPPAAHRPQSVRGLKKIEFLGGIGRDIEAISEESVDQSPKDIIKNQPNLGEEPIYRTILEMVLHRPLAEGALLDDTDTISNPMALELLFALGGAGGMAVKQRVLQDLLVLTKWNSGNVGVLAGSQAWHYYVMKVMVGAETQRTPEMTMVWDMGTRLQTLILTHILQVDEDGWKFLSRLFTWVESLSSHPDHPHAHSALRHLLSSLCDSLRPITATTRASIASVVWRNVVMLGFLLEEMVVGMRDDRGEGGEERGVAMGWGNCENEIVLKAYFEVLDQIWPISLFEPVDDPEILQSPAYIHLLSSITRHSKDGLKLDPQLLFFDPPSDLKPRGPFLKTLSFLCLLSLTSSPDPESGLYWSSIVSRLGRLLLLIGETGKKGYTSAMFKQVSACFIYLLGGLQQVVARRSEAIAMIAKDCLCVLLSSLFAVYVSGTNTSPMREKVLSGILASQKIAAEIAETVINSGVGAPLVSLGDLESMKRRQFDRLEGLIDTEEWSTALERLYLTVSSMFVSEAKSTAILQARRKLMENYTVESHALEGRKEEILRDIQNRVLTTAAERSDKEDQRRNALSVFEKEKGRQRKEHWKRLSGKLTQWKGGWQTGKGIGLQPYHAMDYGLSRPFLKPRSESAFHMLGQEDSRNSLVSNPTDFLTEIASYNKIRKSTTAVLSDEDEPSLIVDAGEDTEATVSVEQLKVGTSLLSYYASEANLIQRECGWVTPMFVRYGLLQVIDSKGDKQLRFVLDEHGDQKFQSHIAMFKYCPPGNKSYVKEWPLECLREVLPRTYVLRHTAIECFFVDGRSVLFNFSTQMDREKMVKKIARLRRAAVPLLSVFKHPNASKLLKQKDATEKWLEWKISNFEYLMHLNFVAGRSFNDITQYPVFPWVVADYSEQSLDIRSSKTYRDLSRPMGALGLDSRYSFFKDRFNSIDPSHGTPKFHFGSHYSNPGIVLYYLLRLFPFTEAEKELQGGRFDLPDRLFMSVAESFRSATEDISDVRELIPEFYFQPEFLLNKDRHDFGTTQSGYQVDHVDLPRWAQSPYDFIRINREVLESDQVSYTLHQWIDLVFGYKQRGSEAEKALNTFYYMTYEESVDLDKIEDEKLRVSTEAQIVNFGKTPSQLFDRPHPQRHNKLKLQPGPSIVSPGAQLKIYYPSTRKQQPRSPNLYNYHELSPRALLKARFCSDNRIVALRNNGILVLYRWWSTPVMGDFKTPFTCAIEKEKKLGRDYRSAGIETRDRSVMGLNAPVVLISEGSIVTQGGYWDGRISVQKSSEREQPTPSCNHYNTVTCIDIDSEEHIAVTGSKDGDCIVWQVEGEYWKARWHFIEHEGAVSSVCISTFLNSFASCSLDASCNIYSLRKGRLLSVIQHPEAAPWHNVVFSPSAPAKVILFSSKTNVLYSFSVNGGLISKAHERASFIISPLVVKDLNQTEYLLYGTEIGEVVIRTVGTFHIIKRVTIVNDTPILTLLPTPDLRFLLAGCADGELTVLTDPTATLSLFESQWQGREKADS